MAGLPKRIIKVAGGKLALAMPAWRLISLMFYDRKHNDSWQSLSKELALFLTSQTRDTSTL